MNNDTLNQILNKSMNNVIKNALLLSINNPRKALFILKTFFRQKRAGQKRLLSEEAGLHVPPFMILSITRRCNLKCSGCYARARKADREPEMNYERLRSLFNEAEELGVSAALIAGGEPLVRKDEIFEIAKSFPDIIFPVFTNGTMVDDKVIESFNLNLNIVPVISIEGKQTETDKRRGNGMFQHLKSVFEKLREKCIFYGVSITVTGENYKTVTCTEYIKELINEGCKLFFFVEYVPVEEGTEGLVLTEKEKRSIPEIMKKLRNEYKGLFIAFPGDEEIFGGCIAAGRGFVHISPEGKVEPCPFAPYSDSNLKDMTLREALKSDYLDIIRSNHAVLNDGKSGCVLWEKRNEVTSLLNSAGKENCIKNSD